MKVTKTYTYVRWSRKRKCTGGAFVKPRTKQRIRVRIYEDGTSSKEKI